MRRVLAHREWAELCAGVEPSWREADWRDKAKQMWEWGTSAEADHLTAPFKAITHYDDYVEPTIHQWDPSSADDTDDSSQYEDSIRHYNQDGWTPEERARSKRHHELADTGRDVVDSLSHLFMHGKFVGYDDDDGDVSSDPRAPAPQYHENAWAYRGMDDSQLDKVTIHHLADTQWNNDAMRATTHQEHPGLTLHDTPGDAPHSGFMVSEPGSEEQESFSRLVPHDIGDYYNRHQDQIHGHPDTYYGGWEDNGDYYQDVSDNIRDPWRATSEAERGHQKAIYDLNQNKSVDTDEAEEQLFNHGQPGYYMARNQPK